MRSCASNSAIAEYGGPYACLCEAWPPLTGLDVKIIAHHQDDINIMRVGFRGDIAAKENQAFQFARGTSEMIDTPQACCHRLSLRCPAPNCASTSSIVA